MDGIDLQSSVLLIVDVQNGFVTEDTQHVVPAIINLAQEWSRAGGYTVYSRYFNYPGSSSERLVNWHRLYGPPETDIANDLAPYAERSTTLSKNTYSACTEDLWKLAQQHGWSDIVVCGIDTDLCVLTTVFDAFDGGLTPWVITDCSASTGGQVAHEAGLIVMGRGIGETHLVTSDELFSGLVTTAGPPLSTG